MPARKRLHLARMRQILQDIVKCYDQAPSRHYGRHQRHWRQIFQILHHRQRHYWREQQYQVAMHAHVDVEEPHSVL